MEYLSNNKDLYTHIQVENIYFIEGNDANNINVLKSFFDEVIRRDKGDDAAGLQATGLIIGNRGAFKINENDGIDSHNITGVNLLNAMEYRKNSKLKRIYATGLMNRKREYYSSEYTRITSLGLEVRIIFNTGCLEVLCIDYSDSFSTYKKDVIALIFALCKNICNKGLIDSIYIGFANKKVCYETDSLDPESYNDALNNLYGINDKKKKLEFS